MIKSFTRKILGKSSQKKPKVFVIGFNKTGTTSVRNALFELGYSIGTQRDAEVLIKPISEGNFNPLRTYLKTADAFQDVPFSCPRLYEEIYKWYPDAYYILSVRSSPEEWYNSLCKYHGKLWSNSEGSPTPEELKNADYRYPGYAYDYISLVFGQVDYEEGHFKSVYNNHNKNVQSFFQKNNGKFLVLNVAEKDSYLNMCDFLNVVPLRESFEWKNKTD